MSDFISISQQQKEVWKAIDKANVDEVKRLLKEAPVEVFTTFNPDWEVSQWCGVMVLYISKITIIIA
jgi:hypothetical protein